MTSENRQITLNSFTKDEKNPYQDGVAETFPRLPKEWRWAKLKDLSKVLYGKGLSRKLRKPDGLYGVYGSNGLIDRTDEYLVEHPTIVIGRKGSVGALTLVMEKSWPIDTTFYLKLNNTKEVDLRYIYLALHGVDFAPLAIITAVPGINREDLENVKLPLPPLEEQRRIVARIEEMTSRIEQAKKLREEALKDAEAIMQSALHQIFSSAEEKGWGSKQLEEVAQINPESRNPSATAPDEEFTYIEISSIESGSGRIAQVKRILGRDAPSRARRVVHYNDVLMSTVRPYLKSFAIVPKKYDNQICSTGFAVLTSRESLLPRYLLYCLFSDTVINQCNSMMIGAHYPALNQKQVAKIKIAVPSIEEQNRIIRYLDSINEKNQTLRKHQEKTKKEIEAITQAVLRKAFIGQL